MKKKPDANQQHNMDSLTNPPKRSRINVELTSHSLSSQLPRENIDKSLRSVPISSVFNRLFRDITKLKHTNEQHNVTPPNHLHVSSAKHIPIDRGNYTSTAFKFQFLYVN